MRSRLSPAAKLAAAVGALLSLATTRYELDRNTLSQEDLGEITLNEGSMVYVAGYADASTIAFHLVGESSSSSRGTLKLWRLGGPLEGGLPEDAALVQALSISRATPGGTQGLDVALEDEEPQGEFAYAIVLEGDTTVVGELGIEACCQEEDGEDTVDLEITAFEVIPAAEEEADTAAP